MTLPPTDYEVLDQGLNAACESNKLQPVDEFYEKIHQLYEMILVRHGLMIVGLPDSGKSAMLKVLGLGLSHLFDRGYIVY